MLRKEDGSNILVAKSYITDMMREGWVGKEMWIDFGENSSCSEQVLFHDNPNPKVRRSLHALLFWPRGTSKLLRGLEQADKPPARAPRATLRKPPPPRKPTPAPFTSRTPAYHVGPSTLKSSVLMFGLAFFRLLALIWQSTIDVLPHVIQSVEIKGLICSFIYTHILLWALGIIVWWGNL